MCLFIAYIIPSFVSSFVAPWQEVLVCVIFAFLVGGIAYIGVTGSTLANIVIYVIQIVALGVFSILAIAFRVHHPYVHYLHTTALSVILPHDMSRLTF